MAKNKIGKRKGKRRKKFRYSQDRSDNRRRKLKKAPASCTPILEAWERNKTLLCNYQEMGLVADVNEHNQLAQQFKASEADKKLEENPPPKKHVVEEIEQIAKTKSRRRRKKVMSPDLARWLTYLIKKYQEDYHAMARDHKNYYQSTWKQIRAKINNFKNETDLYQQFMSSNNSEEMEVSQ